MSHNTDNKCYLGKLIFCDIDSQLFEALNNDRCSVEDFRQISKLQPLINNIQQNKATLGGVILHTMVMVQSRYIKIFPGNPFFRQSGIISLQNYLPLLIQQNIYHNDKPFFMTSSDARYLFNLLILAISCESTSCQLLRCMANMIIAKNLWKKETSLSDEKLESTHSFYEDWSAKAFELNKEIGNYSNVLRLFNVGQINDLNCLFSATSMNSMNNEKMNPKKISGMESLRSVEAKAMLATLATLSVVVYVFTSSLTWPYNAVVGPQKLWSFVFKPTVWKRALGWMATGAWSVVVSLGAYTMSYMGLSLFKTKATTSSDKQETTPVSTSVQ